MEKIKKIYFPVYDYTVTIIITENIEESRRKRNRFLDPTFVACRNTLGLHSYGENANSFIFITPEICIGDIAHECSHCVLRIFSWLEAEFEEENFCYHLGYLTQQVYDFINSINK